MPTRLRRRAIATLLAIAPMIAADDPGPAGPRLLDQPAADFRGRRKELMSRVLAAETARLGIGPERSGEPIIAIRGRADGQGEDYEEGRFRQSNAFAYLTGVSVPGAALLLRPKSGQEILYIPPPGNPGLGPRRDERSAADAAAEYQFDRVESTGQFLGDIFKALDDPMQATRGARRGVRPVLYTLGTAAEATSSLAKFSRFVREGAPATPQRDVEPFVSELRRIKSPGEVDLIRRAIAITGDAQREVVRGVRPEIGENRLEARIAAAFLDGGASRAAFSSIVGSGPNACIPHYFENSRTMRGGDLVVVDIGAEYRYYAADVTRTYPVDGEFTPRQREIYQLVLDAQSHAAGKVEPGKTLNASLNGLAREFMRQSPLRAKDAAGVERTMDHFFIHGLGHYLGMEVHDVGDYSKPLVPGVVFTIEPGLYIPGENIGVRIEDDYLVTATGVEKLSGAIPSDPSEVVKAIADARRP